MNFFQYLVLDKIVIAFTAKNTLFSLCYFNVDFCNKYANLLCVAKLVCFSICVSGELSSVINLWLAKL